MTYILSKIADEYFDGYQYDAYLAMKETGLWERFADNYEVLHSQSDEYNLEDAKEYLKAHIKQ